MLGEDRVKSFQFPPILPFELARELAMWDAAQKLGLYEKGMYDGFHTAEIEKRRAEMAAWSGYR